MDKSNLKTQTHPRPKKAIRDQLGGPSIVGIYMFTPKRMNHSNSHQEIFPATRRIKPLWRLMYSPKRKKKEKNEIPWCCKNKGRTFSWTSRSADQILEVFNACSFRQKSDGWSAREEAKERRKSEVQISFGGVDYDICMIWDKGK